MLTQYIASDGMPFTNENECRQYERMIGYRGLIGKTVRYEHRDAYTYDLMSYIDNIVPTRFECTNNGSTQKMFWFSGGKEHWALFTTIKTDKQGNPVVIDDDY